MDMKPTISRWSGKGLLSGFTQSPSCLNCPAASKTSDNVTLGGTMAEVSFDMSSVCMYSATRDQKRFGDIVPEFAQFLGIYLFRVITDHIYS